MAYTLVTTIKNYIGESTDVKPTVGIPAGSLFYESDTKAMYKYTGSAWVICPDRWEA
jgi:hypothetical protein